MSEEEASGAEAEAAPEEVDASKPESEEEEEEEKAITHIIGFPPTKVEKTDETEEKKFENTYQLYPTVQVNRNEIQKLVQNLLQTNLEGKSYECLEMKELSVKLSTAIKEEIKTFNYERYKIVCYVVIGEKMGQGLHIGNQNLWDTERDHIIYGTFENASLFAGAVVALMYKC